MTYLGVKNLEKYQHYKDRDPKWIKLYYSILDDEAFIFLDEVDRCRYMTCLVLASRTNNKIPSDPTYLKKVMRLDRAPDLSRLLSCGLLYAYDTSSPRLDKDYTNAPVQNVSLLSSPLISSSLSYPKSEEGKKSEEGEFETFWKNYPRRVGKKAAHKAFQNAQDRPRIDDLLAALRIQTLSPQWLKDNGQFIPHPATWLNRGQWADVAVAAQPSVFQEFLARGAHDDESTGVFEGVAFTDGAALGADVSHREYEPTEP